VADELEPRVVMQMIDVAFGAGEEVVDAEHFVALLQQSIAQMRAEEARAAGDQDAPAGIVVAHSRPYCFHHKAFECSASSTESSSVGAHRGLCLRPNRTSAR
jgi:hypothetical protein